MDNMLRKIHVDDEIIVYKEETFASVDKVLFVRQFERYRENGKIVGHFEDDIWICNSDIEKFRIRFKYDEVAYFTHMKPVIGVGVSEVREMMKCFVVYISGEFIHRTIARKINLLKRVLTEYGESKLVIYKREKQTLIQFLAFIGLDEAVISEIKSGIKTKADPKSHMRKLAKFINYLAIDNELTDMYTDDISDKEFIRWFPIWFWCKITFLIPLRATEMLVTPRKCIKRRGSDVYILLRRTMLKKGKRTVYYDIDKDYRIFEYQVPDNDTIKLIEKYIRLTNKHERRFLFDYSALSTNGILSLPCFNNLLEAFVRKKLIGNRKYDFAKHAGAIKEFSIVVAGDSRPIAMSNIYYSGCGAEICRQLADHMTLKTSQGYYENVAETIKASSIMKMQRMINDEYKKNEKEKRRYMTLSHIAGEEQCLSARKPKKTGDIADCIKNGHIDDDCVGCPYHNPSEKELEVELNKRRKEFERAGKAMLECIVKGEDIQSIDKVMLNAHTSSVRFRMAYDEKIKKEFTKWERCRNTVRN